MTQSKRIALDAMGGDHAPGIVVEAACLALRQDPGLRLILVGDEQRLQTLVAQCGADLAQRLEIRHASQVVGMDELPSQALRGKKDSSMRRAIELVKSGEAAACISAGNTGALMATARFVLKTLPGIDRPAILTAIPSMRGRTLMLDLGANIDCAAEHLFQFAVMGSVVAEHVEGIVSPRVGLLNIGEEEIKGNEQVKEAARLLHASPLNYAGYVEGDGIYSGEVDVVVCDGFVGNVSLKTSEGVARMIAHFLRQAFNRGPLSRLLGLLALPVLRAFRDSIDPRRYNGASLLGLRGIVVKSHGGADALAFANAIKVAVREVEIAVPERIEQQLSSYLQQREAV